ncbi:hypothetical protein [Bifidobacterium pseudocatenulatum]|jgi:ribosomal protein S18|uniref:Molecular chaperone n=1 Tax=Bifidobacterium pseudocatenulatum TaxID=28026 RepID=A0AAQ0LRY4_BIFPS|nr:hypothetical protein [Bifidobacterium pseudocatenulatum]RGN28157.1 hypothetical protein DXB66_09105 [Bifidobacterium pseudocatenulatum]RHJ82645.1 hypothetical protein DW101_09165 [Bifidobacterium pseudocatenulatum]RHL93972.1 hypothetical protein DWZ91_09430 [Bifidobacterium pseudocatenulatum]
MISEQPSLFDQLTPSDALRDDLDWLDSLQETKPSTPPRKPKNRRSNRKHDIEPVQHDDKHETTTTPPTETTVPATVQDTVALPPVSEGATDTTPVPQSTGVENDQTAEHPEPSMPSSDTRPMPAFPLPPRPAMEDANVPDEAENTLISMIPVGNETPSDIPPVATETASGGIRTTVSLQDVADPDGPSEDARTMVWVRRGLIGALTFILLLVLFAIMGSHSATVRQQASAERLQTSMSQLSTWTGKAKTTIKQAYRIGLKDTDDIDSLRRLIDSNGRLMHSDRTGLSENESERLAAKADKATKRTRTLTNKIGRLVKEKPLTDAKNKCHTALDKASKASNDAKPSDDATRTAKATLDKLIAQARKLDKKTTIDTWTDMAAKLDKARENLARALDAKTKADEEAKRQAEAQEQQQQQQAAPIPTPAPTPTPQYHGSSGGSGSTTVPRGNNSGGSSGGNSGGWYVPPETPDNSLPNNDSSL